MTTDQEYREELRVAGGTTMGVLWAAPAGGPGAADGAEGLRLRAEELLAEHGAVMIHGLGIADAEEFHAAVDRFGDRLIRSYRGGNTPRVAVSDGVFTSTEYPARFEISLHNELSYAHSWPRRLFFGCLLAAETGGATPVCDGAALLAALDPELRARFAAGVTYRQYLHGGYGLGKSWQATFETEDRVEVEGFLRESEAEFAWTPEGGLRVIQHRQGILEHPVTGRPVWFNQADQWHPSNLPEGEAGTLLSLIDSTDDLPHWVTYRDGSPIPDEDLAKVREAARRHRLSVPWQDGSLLVVDNLRVLHGREAYTGARRVLVSMT
ncbi:TauD/TfdA family dioxygenase [Kitasatospora sp. NPDC093806]|uniref:TauD/TfdA family dioxygenase n=1 Tax=Kitasatospora sp. NPDC093806 TaxID=3155075 RepID=UPI003433A87A